MIGITGFGTELTKHGPVTYIEVVFPDRDTARIAVEAEFVEVLMDLVDRKKHDYHNIHNEPEVTQPAPRPPEPEPYVLQPEPDFAPSFPAVSHAPGQMRKVPKKAEQFSAKNLLANVLGKPTGKEPEPPQVRQQPKKEPAPRKLAAPLPSGDFYHFFED